MSHNGVVTYRNKTSLIQRQESGQWSYLSL